MRTFVEDDFKTDLDLQVACLILEQQVKLINGNEANLLVPQDWMKKYLEDQARGVQQSNQQPSQTQIKSMSIVVEYSESYSLFLLKVLKLQRCFHQL